MCQGNDILTSDLSLGDTPSSSSVVKLPCLWLKLSSMWFCVLDSLVEDGDEETVPERDIAGASVDIALLNND